MELEVGIFPFNQRTDEIGPAEQAMLDNPADSFALEASLPTVGKTIYLGLWTGAVRVCLEANEFALERDVFLFRHG